MVFGNTQEHIKRAGLATTLAATLVFSLAACGGTASPTAAPTAQSTATVADSGVDPIGTTEAMLPNEALATAPAALPTEGMDMGEMAEGTTTPAEPTTGTAAEATATTPSGDQGTSAGSSVEVQGTLREWAIDLSQQEVPAGKVVFIVTNEGQFAHNFSVEDGTGVIAKTPNFSKADGAQTLEIELAPGTYNVICSLPGHAARGQQTILVVK